MAFRRTKSTYVPSTSEVCMTFIFLTEVRKHVTSDLVKTTLFLFIEPCEGYLYRYSDED